MGERSRNSRVGTENSSLIPVYHTRHIKRCTGLRPRLVGPTNRTIPSRLVDHVVSPKGNHVSTCTEKLSAEYDIAFPWFVAFLHVTWCSHICGGSIWLHCLLESDPVRTRQCWFMYVIQWDRECDGTIPFNLLLYLVETSRRTFCPTTCTVYIYKNCLNSLQVVVEISFHYNID